MPRPRLDKKVCSLPEITTYGPKGKKVIETERIFMQVEEYEALRLIDYEGLNQTEAADMMDVGRSTIQRLYDSARRKLVKTIVDGYTLDIQGGNYRLCHRHGERGPCMKRGCRKKNE